MQMILESISFSPSIFSPSPKIFLYRGWLSSCALWNLEFRGSSFDKLIQRKEEHKWLYKPSICACLQKKSCSIQSSIFDKYSLSNFGAIIYTQAEGSRFIFQLTNISYFSGCISTLSGCLTSKLCILTKVFVFLLGMWHFVCYLPWFY